MVIQLDCNYARVGECFEFLFSFSERLLSFAKRGDAREFGGCFDYFLVAEIYKSDFKKIAKKSVSRTVSKRKKGLGIRKQKFLNCSFRDRSSSPLGIALA
ncbi:hypothetical protein TSAR_006450 [Trichomalopsis sarcophagae]|uniref:Uncharacterized protein n=1 Tax=Trichomalopsis sarcophagae TaxID=543379 RepID=A0A232FG79_9HYME|nr:hypothetical protein TSAR_006450 [Trichomalopsis sarcophagae]